MWHRMFLDVLRCVLYAIIKEAPTRPLWIAGKLERLSDIGTNVSLLSHQSWPSHWPTHGTQAELWGVGVSHGLQKVPKFLTGKLMVIQLPSRHMCCESWQLSL